MSIIPDSPRRPLLTVALSTTGLSFSSIKKLVTDLDKQTFQDFELLVILQNTDENVTTKLCRLLKGTLKRAHGRVIGSDTTGLLKSRNIALAESAADLVLLADDDCRYPKHSLSLLVQRAARMPECEILTFQSIAPDGSLRNRRGAHNVPYEHTTWTLMSVSSIEIALRQSLLARQGNKLFDERFGLGTQFMTGGENIMLLDMRRLGATIVSCPEVIVVHPHAGSGRGRGTNVDTLAYAKGAMFRRMFGWLGVPLLLIFLTKHILSQSGIRFSPSSYWTALRGFIAAPIDGPTRN